MRQAPLASTWLWREDRSPRVKLVANPRYWDVARGPHLAQVVFRNDLSPQQALERVCDTEGEVDLVTEVAPADAARVRASRYARLVTLDAARSIAGIINRDSAALPLGDKRARRALNLAVDRERLVSEVLLGWGRPLGGLTPVTRATRLLAAKPLAHDASRARALWAEAGGRPGQVLHLAAPRVLEPVARRVAADLEAVLSLTVPLTLLEGEALLEARRRLAERTQPREWDVLLHAQFIQEADGPALELHHAFVAEAGELRAGPPLPAFEELFSRLVGTTSKVKQAAVSYLLDRLVRDEALVLSLCSPDALYAVNRHVDFTPYRTTFELPECQVGPGHWSRR